MKKILLLCSAGMSTSIIVKKMQDAAKKRNLEVQIDATTSAKFFESIDNYDIFLLGPQIKYEKEGLQAAARDKNKPLDVISIMDYGTMNGDKILDFALNLKVQ